MKRIIFGIGSNLGDRELSIEKAIDFLVAELGLQYVKKSEIFRNPAMMPEGAPKEWDIEFCNVAMSGNIDLKRFEPLEILKISQNIEKKIGRTREKRWAPRRIDIDILKIEDLEVKIDGVLEVPHPGLLVRDFFVKTVAQV